MSSRTKRTRSRKKPLPPPRTSRKNPAPSAISTMPMSAAPTIPTAKRIEAGRDMMIGGIGESPLTHKSIVEWREKLKAGALLLRDIIDLDATMGGNLPEGASLEGPSAADFEEEEPEEENEAEGEN